MADHRRQIEDGVDRDPSEYGMYRSDDRDYHDRYRSEPSWGRMERGGYWRRYEKPRQLPAHGKGTPGKSTTRTTA